MLSGYAAVSPAFPGPSFTRRRWPRDGGNGLGYLPRASKRGHPVDSTFERRAYAPAKPVGVGHGAPKAHW
eukprot:11544070-Alexandrium_andersonii.AAC.1